MRLVQVQAVAQESRHVAEAGAEERAVEEAALRAGKVPADRTQPCEWQRETATYEVQGL